MRIVRTDHIKDTDNKIVVQNYHCIAGTSNRGKELCREISEFIKNNRLSAGIPVNVILYTTTQTAEIEDYHSITGEEYVELANSQYMCYINDVILEWAMKDDIYDYILEDMFVRGSKTVSDIITEMQEEQLTAACNTEQLRLLRYYLNESKEGIK